MSAPRVTSDDMRAAAEWLDCYDGQEGDEVDPACKRVAAWLLAQADARDVRQLSRASKLPAGTVRRMVEGMRQRAAAQGVK